MTQFVNENKPEVVLPAVLIWGGRSQARIVEEMLRESGLAKLLLFLIIHLRRRNLKPVLRL